MSGKPWLLLGLSLWGAACGGDAVNLGGGPPDFSCGERCFVDRELPPNTGEWFYGKAAPAEVAPQIAYPLEETTLPDGLAELTVQWRRLDRAQRFHRLRFTAPALRQSFDFYAPCLATEAEGCRYSLPDYLLLAMSSAFRGQDVELTISASAGPGSVVATSSPRHLRFTPERLENSGFYYWGIDDEGVGVTYRLAFGARRPDVFIEPMSSTNPEGCSGCHTLSLDGSMIAFTARSDTVSPDQREGHLVVSLTTAPTTQIVAPQTDGSYDSSMMALSPDGTLALVAFDNQLVLRHTIAGQGFAAGDPITTVPSSMLGGSAGYFPEFSSPNGDAVALALSSDPDSPHAVKSGSIAIMSFDLQAARSAPAGTPASSIFGSPEVLVPGSADEFHFYPTWSPDGRYIAFVSAPRGALQISANQKQARLRLVRREGGTPIELSRATQGAGNWSTLPRFAPFPPEAQGGLMFLTYNSKIDYGLLLRNSAIPEQYRYAQLWMSAIDVSQLPGDPSSAPVWLPFQNFTHQSHFGYWATQVTCRNDVADDTLSCGPDEYCDRSVTPSICLVLPR